MIPLRPRGGRYPDRRNVIYHKQHVRATLTAQGGVVRIRIEDDRFDERWEEFEVPAAEVLRVLRD